MLSAIIFNRIFNQHFVLSYYASMKSFMMDSSICKELFAVPMLENGEKSLRDLRGSHSHSTLFALCFRRFQRRAFFRISAVASLRYSGLIFLVSSFKVYNMGEPPFSAVFWKRKYGWGKQSLSVLRIKKILYENFPSVYPWA